MPSVFEKFDGIRPMAAKLGVPPSTVSSWRQSAVIPAWRHRDILAVAKKHRIELTPDELVNLRPDETPPEKRRGRRHAADRRQAAA